MGWEEDLRAAIQQGIDTTKKNLGAVFATNTGNEVKQTQIGSNPPDPAATGFVATAGDVAGKAVAVPFFVLVALGGLALWLIFKPKKGKG